MSPPKLPKKLKQAKMAWKTFTKKLHSNLQKLHIPPSIKAASHCFLKFCSLRLYAPFKMRFLARSSSFPFHHYHHHQQNKSYNNFKAVFIDNLYADHVFAREEQGASSSTGKAVAEGGSRNRKNHQRRREEELVEENSNYSIEDAWKHVVASSPHLRGVDERAEDFIHKFKEEMKLEKEKSLLEFQERLARSA